MIDSHFVIDQLVDGATLVPCPGGALLQPAPGSASILVTTEVVYELLAHEVIELADGTYVLLPDQDD